MTPEMYFDMAGDERTRNSRKSRRRSAVESAPIASNRFLMVPDDSSAARMPRPGATMASATLLSSARFIVFSHGFGISGRFCRLFVTLAKGDDARYLPSFCPQHLDPGQGFALQPFEEGAAGGRDVGELPGHTGAVERCDRIPDTRDRYQLPGGG